jgi:hypothetical protein
MAASALLLRTGDDAGSYRSGSPVEPRPVSVYIDRPQLRPVSNVLVGRNGLVSSTSFGVILPTGTLSAPTGNETMTASRASAVRNWVPLVDLSVEPTGYGWMLAPLLTAFASDGDPTDLDQTDEGIVALSMGPHGGTSAPARAEAPSENTPEAYAASRVRELSGLEAEKVSDLLGVTRTAFYDWLGGVKPRGKRRYHLFQVQHGIEEAARRLGSSREVAAWLVTPTPSGRLPIELLKTHQYDLCRALLTKSSKPRLPSRSRRRLDSEALGSALDRITPRPAPEDYDDGPADE